MNGRVEKSLLQQHIHLAKCKISLVHQTFILAAAACTDIKLQINLARIIPQNDSCNDQTTFVQIPCDLASLEFSHYQKL